MNIVLFKDSEVLQPLPRRDPRAEHILRVLRRTVGDDFDAGLINGPRGKAAVQAITPTHLALSFTWAEPPPPPPPTGLAVGFPRPQTARDILRDATTLGATELSFVRTHRCDPNYAKSSLWLSGEWQRHLITGAAQAFDTFIPRTRWDQNLQSTLNEWRPAGQELIALDVYGEHPHLATWTVPDPARGCALFIGPERGWDAVDRAELEAAGAKWFSLGPRVLRTETAVVAGLSLINAARARAGK